MSEICKFIKNRQCLYTEWKNSPYIPLLDNPRNSFVNYLKCIYHYKYTIPSGIPTCACISSQTYLDSPNQDWKAGGDLMCSDFVNKCIQNFSSRDLEYKIFERCKLGLLNIKGVMDTFRNLVHYGADNINNIPNGAIVFVRSVDDNILFPKNSTDTLTYKHVMFHLEEDYIIGMNHSNPQKKNGFYHLNELYQYSGRDIFTDISSTDRKVYLDWLKYEDFI